jgi:hypothetical protein
VNSWYSSDQNPRRVALKVSGKYNYYLARGADGRVYVGQHHERDSEGGSLGWYDPRTGESGGLREPFLEHDVSDVIAIDEGRTIVVSTRGIHGRVGQLVAYDTASQTITTQFAPLPGCPDTGSLIDAGPHQVLGVVRAEPLPGGASQSSALIYRADLKSRKLLFKRSISGRVFSGSLPNDLLAADRRLVRGPDGCGWLFIDNQLTRIHPDDGSPEPVAKCDVTGRLLFVGTDLYIYNGGRQYFGGFASLKRIRSILTQN